MDTQTLAIVTLIATLVVGIVFCFFGNRWLKAIVSVYGFMLGFMLASELLPMFTTLGDLPVLLISIGFGIVGALLFVFFMYAGIFFLGFGAGVLLCLLIANVFDLNILEWYVYVPTLVIGCILGSLTLNKRRIFMSIFTAYIGASALAIFIYSVINGIKLETLTSVGNPEKMYIVYTSTEYLVSLAALFVAGLIVQLAITGKSNSKRKSS